MGRKTWEAKNSKKKRSSYKNGLGKKWEAHRSKKKRWHLESDGKNGKQRTPRNNGHLTQRDGEKSGKQIDPQKNWHLEWDGKNGKQRIPSKKRSSYKNGLGRKNGKQINQTKTGILNGTEKMGSKNGKQRIPSEN